MIKFTEKELDVLNNGIIGNDFGDRVNDPVWRETLVDYCKIVESRGISGVVSSLVKKGIVQTNGETVWIVPEANEYMTDGIFVNNDEPVPGVTESARMWPDGTISCNSCGSSRTQTKLLNAENGWIEVFCKKCGEVLFYNGA